MKAVAACTVIGLSLWAGASPSLADTVTSSDTKGFYATMGLGAQWASGTKFGSNLVNPPYPNYSTSGTIGGGGGGFSGDWGVGYDFGKVRTELTYGYSRGSYGGGAYVPSIPGFSNSFLNNNNGSNAYNKNDILVSAYYDIPTKTRWTPYVGGGIGWTNLTAPQQPGSNGETKNLFGYQAKLGVSYTVSKTWDVYSEAVYQGTPGYGASSPYGSTTYSGFNSWGAKIGARLKFAN